MATVKVVSLGEVLIDGVSAGQLMDVVRNHAQLLSDVQGALVEWENGRQAATAQQLADLRTAHAADVDALTAQLGAAHDAELAEVRRKHELAVTDLKGEIAAAQEALKAAREELVTVTDERDALGTKPEAQEIRRQQRKQQLADAIAQAQAELAQLDKAAAVPAVGDVGGI